MSRIAWGLITTVMLAACGGGSSDPSASESLSVLTPAEATSRSGTVAVQGFLWSDSPDGMRICDALMESFPPQCGDPHVAVEGIDITTVAGTDFFENIFWAEGVRVVGTMADGILQASRVELSSSANGLNGRILVPVNVTSPRPGWTVLLSNPGDAPVEVTFSSGQDADVLIRDSSGETVYAWSATFSFVQGLRNELLAPGETRRFQLEGVPHNLDSGAYDLEASFVSEPAPGIMRGVVQIR